MKPEEHAMEREGPSIEVIFGDQGGNAIDQLGQHLAKKIKDVNKTQMRKFLTELKTVQQAKEFEFALSRFRWISRYIEAQEKKLKPLGECLRAAAQKVAEADKSHQPKYFERLQALMESVYAHYLYGQEQKGNSDA